MQITNSTQNDISAKIIQRKNLLIKDGKHKKITPSIIYHFVVIKTQSQKNVLPTKLNMQISPQ